jgi:ferredoxin
MTHIITSLCLRDAGCIEVCPVECIVPGKPEAEWPWMYIDPDTCIDCGACVPECPWEAIFPEDEVPSAHEAKDGQRVSAPQDPNFAGRAPEHYEGESKRGAVHLDTVVTLAAGEVIDLTADTAKNYAFYKEGPGYSANNA